ncbi:MAG: Lrp/AsnC family transcriptional regulator [Chitinophagales bacterium]|nr:Lrp/AsnC family transcriptional regulator [Hyphomicrobiales bacterium]
MSNRIDGKDRKILSILLRSAETPKAEIARRVGLAASAVFERIRRLEKTGLIQRYETRLDGKPLGFSLLAFVFVRETKPNHGFDTGAVLARVRGVEEVHKIAGEDCFLLKIRAEGTEELSAVLDQDINTIQTVSGVRTTIVLRSILEGPPLSGVKSFDIDTGRESEDDSGEAS